MKLKLAWRRWPSWAGEKKTAAFRSSGGAGRRSRPVLFPRPEPGLYPQKVSQLAEGEGETTKSFVAGLPAGTG